LDAWLKKILEIPLPTEILDQGFETALQKFFSSPRDAGLDKHFGIVGIRISEDTNGEAFLSIKFETEVSLDSGRGRQNLQVKVRRQLQAFENLKNALERALPAKEPAEDDRHSINFLLDSVPVSDFEKHIYGGQISTGNGKHIDNFMPKTLADKLKPIYERIPGERENAAHSINPDKGVELETWLSKLVTWPDDKSLRGCWLRWAHLLNQFFTL